MTARRAPRHDAGDAELDLALAASPMLASLVKLFAREVARELARQLPELRADELVDRKTAPIAKRAWDRYAGAADGFEAYVDGRRKVAKRSAVLAWLERSRKVARAEHEPPDGDLDEDERALARAGLRFNARDGGRR